MFSGRLSGGNTSANGPTIPGSQRHNIYNLPNTYTDETDFPEEYFNQWATIWKELWMCADQVKIKDFRDNMTWKKWREECWPPEKRDLLMFGPSVY